MSAPINITDDTLASLLVPVQCASLAPPATKVLKFKRQEKTEGTNLTSIEMVHTHRYDIS